MSILSQLFSGKITFSQAESQVDTWFSTILSKAPAAVQGDVATASSALKQAASDAVGLADTALGGILATGSTIVESAANTALNATIGPIAAATLTPAVDASITAVTNGLKAAIDAEATALRAQLAQGPATVTVQPTPTPLP